VVKQGYYRASPQATRRNWLWVGIAVTAIAAVLGVVLGSGLSAYADAAICPFLGLGLVGVALMIASRAMPARTQAGAEAAAKWLAFKRYLQDIEKYTKLEAATGIFDKYLPYAIAFGFNNEFAQKFAALGTPAPSWYQTYPPIYIGPGYYGRSGAGGGRERMEYPTSGGCYSCRPRLRGSIQLK
ncbi:MAG: DUF2207 domain-containing protein, partial [Chloroflexi bacterium]|nr:DUF2207 domain-containing protein [Chloroflexota bacterium]